MDKNKAIQPENILRLFVDNWNNRRADLLAELFEEHEDFIYQQMTIY